MPEFSEKSKEKLATCDPRLQLLCNEVIKIADFSVLCGHRDEETQNSLYEQGKSQLQWPYGKHNAKPSLAVDIAPYPIDFHDLVRFRNLASLMKAMARRLDINIKWGGDWKNFKDYPHWELG